jgi:hypothetical protein
MDIKKYLAALQAKEAIQQANFGNDANTVLGMFCNTYYEPNCNQAQKRLGKPLMTSVKP